jgi:hypothetical protein
MSTCSPRHFLPWSQTTVLTRPQQAAARPALKQPCNATESTARCFRCEHRPEEKDVQISFADYLVHLSNFLLLISYSVRDILWLRWFAVAAAFIVMPYYLAQPNILWPPVFWGGVFAAINLYQIALIYWERRPVQLNDEEQALYDMAFKSIRPRDFVSLLMVGEWKKAEPGVRLLTTGKPTDAISIAISGVLEVRKGPTVIGRLHPGQTIGLALAVTEEPSPVDAVFVTVGRFVTWPTANLRGFLDRKTDIRAALQRHVNAELAKRMQDAVLR